MKNTNQGKVRNYVARYCVLTAGLFILAFGVALSTKAGIGTSPISCPPYVLSLMTPWTMGEITIAMHVCFILLQIALLRKNYQPIQLLQLPIAFVFGFFTDITLAMVKDLQVPNYAMQLVWCFLSIILTAIGVFCEVKADVIMLAGEGTVKAIADVSHKPFPKMKVVFDCTLVAIAVVISLLGLHRVESVREGTILSAILVGIMVNVCDKHIHFVDRIVAYAAAGKKSV
ncbi:MAG: DUF6198 family protein [Oscillospiraceae bacterium]|jgi:uncharacterized membrane protein YczE|nr:DUF6198 family protein [Oscillospiraceae bacterium]